MQDRLPQTRTDDLLRARAGHWSVLRELLPYIWPDNRADLRWRVVLALAALVVA
jgi:ATP-binding cassette subfamily B protein